MLGLGLGAICGANYHSFLKLLTWFVSTVQDCLNDFFGYSITRLTDNHFAILVMLIKFSVYLQFSWRASLY